MSAKDPYLAGLRLYGDDFSPEQIERWFDSEREGYANLHGGERDRYRYGYHALNGWYGYRLLDKARHYAHALGFGSAYGDELAPLAGRVSRVTVVEPSASFVQPTVAGAPSEYVRPSPDGRLSVADAQFDFVSCLSALHHVPNVSTVVREIARCTAPGADVLVREPIVSLGDWNQQRPGLTRNERGIPLAIFRRILLDAGLRIVHETPCGFRPLARALAGRSSDRVAWVVLDAWLSRVSRWNYRYHASRWWHRIRPDSVFFVLTRT